MARIIGTGMALPTKVKTTKQLTKDHKWVKKTVGIKERHIVSEWESSFTLAVDAAVDAIKSAKLKITDIDVLIVATATPDLIAPSTACGLAEVLGANCMAFDINAVCSGFLYAFFLAEKLLTEVDYVLIVGTDTFSTITDWKSRNCIFFGDGAGAVVVSRGTNIKAFFVATDHKDTEGFFCKKGDTFKMDGKIVYDKAMELVPNAVNKVLKESNIIIDDIDYMVPHQPSKKLLLAIADKIGFPREKVLMNMDKYANTSAATIPILLHESWNKFKKGDKLLFVSIGAGWTYGSAIYEV